LGIAPHQFTVAARRKHVEMPAAAGESVFAILRWCHRLASALKNKEQDLAAPSTR
jgi:hypothetical protein